jgi:Predicted metal-dependent membrane protease
MEKKKNWLYEVWKVIYIPLLFLVTQGVTTFIIIMEILFYLILTNFKQLIENPELILSKYSNIVISNIYTIMLISEIICLVVMLLFWIMDRKKLEKKTESLSFVKILLIIFMSIGLNVIVTGILSFTGLENLFPNHSEIMDTMNQAPFWMQVMLAVILAPLVEELCFRGIVYNRLRKNLSLWPSVIIQAVFFGIIHLNMLQFLYATIVGIVFGLMYHKTKSIWAVIIGHMLFNLTSIIVGLLYEIGDVFGYIFLIMYFAFSILVPLAGLLFYKTKSNIEVKVAEQPILE